MKNVWKCVASLTAIAIICTGLLMLCYHLLPQKDNTMDYGALIGESGASFTELDVASLGLDDSYAANILEVRQATSGGKIGALVIKSKGVQNFGSFALYVGLHIVEGRVQILGVMLDNASLENNANVWTQPLKESNFKAFVGKDPTKMSVADLDKSGATLTTQAMIDAVRYAYLAAGKIGGGDTTPAEVKLAKQYFTEADGFAVTDASIVHEATDAKNYDVYEVGLKDVEEAYLFVDKTEGARYDFDGETGALTANAAGAFYQDGATVAVWRDKADSLLKFAGVSTTGKGDGYASAELGLLRNKPLGKLQASGYTAITGTEGEMVEVASDAAGAAGAALIAELNTRMTSYMESWAASNSVEMKFAKSVFASALQAGDEIVSSEIDAAETTATMTVYKVGVQNGAATRYGAIFVSTQPAYFEFNHNKVSDMKVSTEGAANFILTSVRAGVLDDKFWGVEVAGEYKGQMFYKLKDTAKNGMQFGALYVKGFEAVTGGVGTPIVSVGATGTGVAAAATLNGLYTTVMQRYMAGLAGGNE